MKKVEKKDKFDEEKYNMPFPKLLRELMKELKDKKSFTQDKIAKELKMSRQTLSDYQRGVTTPDIYTAKKIVEKFNEWCDSSYTLDYWVGIEKISDDISKDKILLKNSVIEKLLEYQEDERKKIALEIVIENEDFIEKITNYLVNPCLTDLVNDNNDLDYLFQFSEKVSPFYETEKRKYKYYDVVEALPLLAKESEYYIKQNILNSNAMFFAYIDFLKKNNMSSLDSYEEVIKILDKETEKQRRKRIKEQEEFDKEFDKEVKKRKEALELIKEYQKYENRKEVDKDVRSRTRKGKKVSN